jgi:beta-glucosidase
MRPPQQSVPAELDAGEEVSLVLSYQPQRAGGFGEADISVVTFQFNAARQIAEEEEFERAVALAGEADVVVVIVGTTEEVESEGFDRDSLALPGQQDELVRRVAKANPRTVVVVNAGAPVLLPWAEDVAAVLISWFPGQEFGSALADVLLGAAEAGGRLPTSWPAFAGGLPSTRPVDGVLTYEEGLFIGYRAYDREEREPLYPFGHGLGYTTWDYVGIEAPGSVAAGGDLTVRVRVRNTGTRRGREVVQVYASKPDGAVQQPRRWLAGFATVEADPGQEVTAEATVSARSLAHWDVESHRWTVESGTYRLSAGRSSRDLRQSTEIALPTSTSQGTS